MYQRDFGLPQESTYRRGLALLPFSQHIYQPLGEKKLSSVGTPKASGCSGPGNAGMVGQDGQLSPWKFANSFDA